jgi:hypothetical protein
MERVDELNQEAIKFNRFQQQVVRQAQDKHRYQAKRVSNSEVNRFSHRIGI